MQYTPARFSSRVRKGYALSIRWSSTGPPRTSMSLGSDKPDVTLSYASASQGAFSLGNFSVSWRLCPRSARVWFLHLSLNWRNYSHVPVKNGLYLKLCIILVATMNRLSHSKLFSRVQFLIETIDHTRSVFTSERQWLQLSRRQSDRLPRILGPNSAHSAFQRDREDPSTTNCHHVVSQQKINEYAVAERETRDDKSIIILPADKERATVILNRSDYKLKAHDLLNDRHSYRISTEGEFALHTHSANKALERLKAQGHLSQATYVHLKPKERVIARFYWLPEVHKPNCPLRTIVALRNTPMFNMAHWVAEKLKPLVKDWTITVNSPGQFLWERNKEAEALRPWCAGRPPSPTRKPLD